MKNFVFVRMSEVRFVVCKEEYDPGAILPRK